VLTAASYIVELGGISDSARIPRSPTAEPTSASRSIAWRSARRTDASWKSSRLARRLIVAARSVVPG
jgi:hypothetical protein